MVKRITVTKKSRTGRNEQFHDNLTNKNLNREQFIKKINQGNYQNFSVKKINGILTPVSKPDKSKNNNLG